jgi:U3 small nucleolar RNA-associated protein 18
MEGQISIAVMFANTAVEIALHLSDATFSAAEMPRRKRRAEDPLEVGDEEARRIENKLFGSDVSANDAGDASHGELSGQEELGPPEDGASEVLQPVWIDPDEEPAAVRLASHARTRKLRRNDAENSVSGSEYVKRLRQQHRRLHPNTHWATLSSSDSKQLQQPLSSILRGTSLSSLSNEEGSHLSAARTPLPSGTLDAVRVRDLNAEEPSNVSLTSVDFHTNAQLALAGGLDRRIRLFHVDGTSNPKIETLKLQEMPVSRARFAGVSHSHVVAAGNRPFLHLADMEQGTVERIANAAPTKGEACPHFALGPSLDASLSSLIAVPGSGGRVKVLSLHTKQRLATLACGGRQAPRPCFGQSDGSLIAGCSDGYVRVFDLRTMRCRSEFSDDGSTGTAAPSSVTSRGGDSLVCIGQPSGVVNMYESPTQKRSKPVASLHNLTTQADVMSLSSCGQMAAVASTQKKDSLRIVHLQSRTVFSNWPTSRTPVHYPMDVAFSPSSGFVTVANARGRALLYRLTHFQSV